MPGKKILRASLIIGDTTAEDQKRNISNIIKITTMQRSHYKKLVKPNELFR